MTGPLVFSRRRFLQQAGAFSALSVAASLDKIGLSAASAQATDYKALVCVFLFGGYDSNHVLLPFDGYTAYNTVRSPATGLNIPQTGAGSMLQIAPTNTGGVRYGLHPSMTQMQALFAQNRLAVVANVGTLVEPLTRTTYRNRTGKAPQQLFSHSDQQQQFMTTISQASLTGVTGWAGRVADKVAWMNSPQATPMAMSFSGSQTFGNGTYSKMLALPTAGNFGFTGDSTTALPGSVAYERAAARSILLGALDANQMTQAAQRTMLGARDASTKLNPTINSADGTAIANAFTGVNSGLATQLRAVARVIRDRATFGHNREIFFVSIGGWDTHSGQMTGMATNLTQVSQAMAAFYQATVGLNIADKVTQFTMSDFNRTFKPNGTGTDHAWGGHHFVLGGAVQGGKLYGAFPNLALAGPDDTSSEGRWIPTTSMEQYAATMASWFGVVPADIAQIFPNLYRFPTANLGFV